MRLQFVFSFSAVVSLFHVAVQPAQAQHFRFSEGLYRIAYADNTVVTVTNDIWNHSPAGKYDIVATGLLPTIVAAAPGWVRWIVEDHTEECHPDGNGEPCCYWLNNYVVIEHPNGEWSGYTHMITGSVSSFGIAVGDWVEAGTAIGLEGSVGCSTGPHLHFEVGLPPATGSPFDTSGGFIMGELLIPVICGIAPQPPYLIDEFGYTAGPCDDNCPDIVEAMGSLSSGQVFCTRADSEVLSNNADSVVYASGSSAQYRSGGSIRLRPGFAADGGCKFSAMITSCNEQD